MSFDIVHGLPGCGKSWRCRELAEGYSARDGRPIWALDQAKTFNTPTGPSFPVAPSPSLEAACRRIWDGKHTLYSPAEEKEIDSICLFLREMRERRQGHGVILLVDEIRYYSSSHFCSRELILAARQWRHLSLSIVANTQRIQDVNGELVAAATMVYTGCCKSPRILEYLRKEFGLDEAQVQALPERKFLETRIGL